jgi:ribosomal protein S18 acetylase RimI-like enzyme
VQSGALPITIRPAQQADLDFLVELSTVAFRRYSRRPVRTMLSMLRDPDCEVLVAVEEMRLGFVAVEIRRLGRDFGPWVRPATAHVDAIAVRRSVIGRGIGRLLLQGADDLARTQGAVSIGLFTARDNIRAQHVFHAAGYRVAGSLGEFYAADQEAIAMFKPL